jgi:hypothetical protein
MGAGTILRSKTRAMLCAGASLTALALACPVYAADLNAWTKASFVTAASPAHLSRGARSGPEETPFHTEHAGSTEFPSTSRRCLFVRFHRSVLIFRWCLTRLGMYSHVSNPRSAGILRLDLTTASQALPGTSMCKLAAVKQKASRTPLAHHLTRIMQPPNLTSLAM